MTPHTPQHAAVEYRALKTAAKLLVHEVGQLDAAASCCRLGRSQIAECCDPNKPDRWLPLDVIADLEKVAGRPIVTAVLARLAHHLLMPQPDAAAGHFDAAVGRALTASSCAATRFIEAKADGKVTPEEAAEFAGLAHETIRLWQVALIHADAPAVPAAEKLRAVAA